MVRKGLSDDGWQQEPCFMRFSAPFRKVPWFRIECRRRPMLLSAGSTERRGCRPTIQELYRTVLCRICVPTQSWRGPPVAPRLIGTSSRFSPAVIDRVGEKRNSSSPPYPENSISGIETVRYGMLLGFFVAFVKHLALPPKVNC